MYRRRRGWPRAPAIGGDAKTPPCNNLIHESTDNLNKKTRVLPWIAAIIVVGAGAAYWYFHAKAPARDPRQAGDRPIPVQTTQARQQDVPELITVNGFVTPLNTVDIRAQVTSTIRQVDVREGQNVQAGQRLFTLDNRADMATSEKATAQIAKDRALLEDAKRNLARNEELFGKQFVAKSAVDSARSNADSLQATLDADIAAARGTNVTVGFSQISAPFAGRVGELNVHLGSLVQPNSAQPLTTITQIDPIEVAFGIPDKQVQKVLARQKEGPVPVTVKVDNNSLAGTLSFVDNAIDTTTGSLKAKARFANPKGQLWSGGLVSVELSPAVFKQAVVVPPRAIQVGPDGQFVYVVDKSDMAQAKPVTVDYLTSELAVVHGIEAGERVVLEGGQNLRAGRRVAEAKAAEARPADDANTEKAADKGKARQATQSAAAQPAAAP